MTGEALHAIGADGARRAKLWLEATTRVHAKWVNPGRLATKKLTFAWSDGANFSFDLGGLLRGGDVDSEEFLAECKKYTTAADQGALYKEYLAKCYRAYTEFPARCDNFMWITWAPFFTTKWDEITTAPFVRAAVEANLVRVLGEVAQPSDVDEDVISAVADRLWIIVLSERQEKHLVPTGEHRGVIEKYIVEQEAADAGI